MSEITVTNNCYIAIYICEYKHFEKHYMSEPARAQGFFSVKRPVPVTCNQ